MFHTPDYYHDMSLRLSEVLDDIGVSEHMVLKRRKTALLEETMEAIVDTVVDITPGKQRSLYKLGSRSEGTTTSGLQSDSDPLGCMNNANIIQDWCEWTRGKGNFLMIQNETTPPGYCLLQRLRPDAPLPATAQMGSTTGKDTSGRILYKNTILDDISLDGHQRQGPSMAIPAQPGLLSSDKVLAFPFKSWPQSTRTWLERQGTNTWPTTEMKRYMKTTTCFVVGVGNKASEHTDFEWRISTSLAERCLMLNLNITQIRCYVLMKMILKTFINLDNESYISSFMCKTVLFHCIASKHSNVWKECNILKCFTYYLLTLSKCISGGNCPHFIDRENNLMAGKLSTEVKHQLLERISHLIPCDGNSLFGIRIDELGDRFQVKLGMIRVVQPPPPPFEETIGVLFLDMAKTVFRLTTAMTSTEDVDLTTLLQHVTRYYRDGNMLEKTACRLLAPLYCTSKGSLIASHDIRTNREVSDEALAWLEAGQDSDVASSRLKLASIMYCVGNSERAAFILNNTDETYKIDVTEPVCGCCNYYARHRKLGFIRLTNPCGVEEIKNIVAFCVTFSSTDINCVPHELQYEMFRSTKEDLQHRGFDDDWMDCAVVDSLPYLYFLQYKTYGNLQRPNDQQHALNKLVRVIEKEDNLAHRETALNLLGQCMEQENRPVDALKYYALSLHHRERNNAAKIHICMCLAKAVRQGLEQTLISDK